MGVRVGVSVRVGTGVRVNVGVKVGTGVRLAVAVGVMGVEVGVTGVEVGFVSVGLAGAVTAAAVTGAAELVELVSLGSEVSGMSAAVAEGPLLAGPEADPAPRLAPAPAWA